MTIKLTSSKAAAGRLLEAYKGSDESVQAEAFEAFAQSIADDVASEYRAAMASNDQRIMAERGFRALTSAETDYYQQVIEALKAPVPKQAFATIPEKAMPLTIIDQVLKDLEEDHPLLAAVHPQSTAYITRWVRNNHTAQRAVWGEITSAISEEITSAFQVIEVTQGKLSAYACISIDMLELGPTFLDGYVRTVLGEALAAGLEYGIVNGIGINGQPVGLRKDISADVTVNQSTGYPDKTAEAVTSFDVAAYGALVAQLSKNEAGRNKNVDLVNGDSLTLIVNNNTFLTKVLPAVRVMGTDGLFRDSFPVATKVVISNALADNEGILTLLDEYQLFVAGNRGIEYSDEFRFLDDQRYFKVVSYAYGRAEDDKSALLLDLTNLAPTTVPVKVNGTVTTVASA